MTSRWLTVVVLLLLASFGGECGEPEAKTRRPQIALPVAMGAVKREATKEPTIILYLTKDGRMLVDLSQFPAPQIRRPDWDGAPRYVFLAWLDGHLRRIRYWHEGMNFKIRDPESPLVVEFHIDKDAAWEHVRYMITTIKTWGFYKIRIAATSKAGSDYTAEELRMLHVPRDDEPKHGGEGKGETTFLDAFLPEEWHFKEGREVAIGRDDSGVVNYKIGEMRTADVRKVQEWASEQVEKDAIVRVTAEATAHFSHVVAVLDRLHLGGITHVWWLKVRPIPPEVVFAKKLPPPSESDD